MSLLDLLQCSTDDDSLLHCLPVELVYKISHYSDFHYALNKEFKSKELVKYIVVEEIESSVIGNLWYDNCRYLNNGRCSDFFRLSTIQDIVYTDKEAVREINDVIREFHKDYLNYKQEMNSKISFSQFYFMVFFIMKSDIADYLSDTDLSSVEDLLFGDDE